MPKPSSIRRSVRHRASSVSDASGDHAAFINSVIAAAGGVVYETPNIENPSGVHALTSADFDTVLNRLVWWTCVHQVLEQHCLPGFHGLETSDDEPRCSVQRGVPRWA
jgi:hypothetical protein